MVGTRRPSSRRQTWGPGVPSVGGMTRTAELRLRSSALRRVIADIEAGAELAWDPDLAEAYGGRDQLLVALHDHWSRQLLARIDVALELGAGKPHESVALAWRTAVRDQPGVRRVLDAESGHPALRTLRRLWDGGPPPDPYPWAA